MKHNYGLISWVDANCIQDTLSLVLKIFPREKINVLEVGVYAGETGNGIRNYVQGEGRNCFLTGIDNNRDGEKIRYSYDKLIIGNSNEVYCEIPPNSQHFVFIDGCHTFPMVISDFYCYAQSVAIGGFIAFHDTGVHINPLHGWQGVGKEDCPDMCLGGVRMALNALGAFGEFGCSTINRIFNIGQNTFKFVFDLADPTDEAGGICCFKKIS